MGQITRKELEDRMILFCKSGSHAYGLNTPESDYDYKGICIAPRRFYFTFEEFDQKDKGWDEQPFRGDHETHFPELNSECDAQVYEIRRYLSLLQSQNPNILEMLWQDPEDYLHMTECGRILVDNREKLISKKIAGSFVEYARGQIKKMETHRKWLLDPPQKRPEWEDYGVSSPFFTPSQIEAFVEYLYLLIKDRIEYYRPSVDLYEIINDRVDWKSVLKQSILPEECVEMTQQLTRANDDYMTLLRVSQRYRSDLKRWHNYQDWLKNRNVKRSEVERVCGYDGKNASHCVRLMRSAIEALRTGKLTVNRKKAGDHELIMGIKMGRLPYEELRDIVDDLFKEADHVVQNECVLPARIEYDYVNELCEKIVLKGAIF